jgi:hypothetical protein
MYAHAYPKFFHEVKTTMTMNKVLINSKTSLFHRHVKQAKVKSIYIYIRYDSIYAKLYFFQYWRVKSEPFT